ncbi:MAG TPA: hypothetical protein ENJ30_05810 [Desulfobulbaceae bacterium]|nr:hypothetical protein [Desulfobulbaceae bacterium]
MGIRHNQRSLRASTLVDEYCQLKGEPFDCLEEVVIDLITDVLILANMEGEDINGIFRMVANHVSAETEVVAGREVA